MIDGVGNLDRGERPLSGRESLFHNKRFFSKVCRYIGQNLMLGFGWISRFQEERLEALNKTLAEVWWLKIASKVVFLLWRALRGGKLPTKDNLRRRGILVENSDMLYPFCQLQSETIQHIFLPCDVVRNMA